MQIAMVGLGRMGSNLTLRLLRAGHEVVVYDTNPGPVDELAQQGAKPARSIAEIAQLLSPPRAAWVMVPAAYAGDVVRDIAGSFEAGDIIVDGGNSYYR